MAEIEEDKFDELCRLCASYDAVQMDIFGEKGRERKIIEKIHTCLPFQVKERDLLPKSICYRCMYNLENFFDFRKGCVDAVTKLEKFVEKSKRNKQFVNGECMTSITTDEEDEPNPADFLEACLAGESVGNGVQTDIREMPPTIVVDLDCLPQRVATPPDDFTCQTCGRTFNSRGALTQHSKYHTGESDQTQVYTCHVCEKAFSSKGHLASHSKVHIGDLADRPTPLIPTPSDIGALRPFKCDLCEKSYSMAKHLWGHVSVSHKGDPKVTCHYCSRTFSTIANLEDHKKYKHNLELEIKAEKVDVKVEARDDEDIVKVEENNSSQSIVEEQGGSRRKSSKPRKIKREVVNHDEIDMKDEPLDLATTSSTAAVTEEESSRSETTDKSISCPFCEGVFPSRTILNQHLLDKHEVNPEDITNSPPHHEDMKMAENMLEAETVFCCEICVRDFNDRASLWLHMLYSHREEAATACGICLRVCSDNVSLMEHVYSCHPKDSLTADQKRYSCQICGRQLDSKKKLLTHVRIHNLYDDTGQTLDPESVIVLNNKNRPIPPPTTNSQPKENNQFEMQHEVFTEEGQLIMSCEICYKVFPNEEKLVKHKQNAHRNSQGPNSINSSTTYFLYFSCELCGLAHSTRTERWRHMFSCHADEPTLLCDQEKCGKVFPTRALRTEHVTTHHSLQGDTPNTCEICGKLWATRVNYWKHMMSVHADCLPFICGVCLKIFCTVPDLSAHVRERHWPLAGSDYCCDICGRPYPNKSKMFRHRKLHVIPEAEGGLPAGHELEDIPPANESRPSLEVFDQQLTCSLCPDQEFLCLEDLSKHRKTAHNLVPCDLCPKFYGRSSHLWKHVNKIHKNHPDITCSVCFRTSASRNHLANHIAKHHRHEVLCQNYIDICELSNEEAVHNCVKCNKVFRKHLLLKKHMRHCTGPPNQIATGPSPCERCSKVFDSPIQLRKHLRNSHLHFKCELCEDVAHDSRIELMNHIKEAHAGDPSLTCDYKGCGMMLRCKSDVAKHRKEHRQGRPPPTCSFCGELTPNKMKLRNHLKSQHPLLTKHLCSICLVTMKDFDELRKHVRSKHKSSLGKTNICPICVRSYSNKSKVLVHIRSHGEGFFPCEICVKVFRDPEKHKRHTDAHFDENSEELEAEEEEEEEEEDAANQEEQEEEEGDCEDEEETVGEEKEKSVKKKKTSEQDNEEEDEEEEEEEGDGDEEDEETKTEDVESVITKRTSDDEDADEKDDVSSSQIEIEDDDTNETVPVKRQRRTHPCIACSKTFTNSTSFLRHMKADHVELICACGKMSENIQSHNNHLKKCITGKKKESAKVEDKKTPTLNRKSLEKKFLNSDSKGMTNTTATPTLKDNNKSSTDKPATTTTPAVNTSNSSSKREVRRVYKSDDGLCSCELCKKHFEAKRHLWQHLRRFHLKEAATSCGVCLKVCKDYESLDSHLAIEHKNNFEGEGKNFTCRVCGRYHNSRSKLEQHSVIHPGQEIRTHAALHSCRWCPLAFNSATSLAVHQSTDHKDKSGDEKMEVDVPDHDEDSRSSTSSSSSANSSCSSSSGSSSSSSASSSSGSSSSTSSSSGSSSSSSNSSEEGGRKDSKDSTKAKDSKVSKLSPLLKQAQRRPEKTAWSSIHKVAVSRSSERNRNNFKTSSPITNKLPNKPNDTLSGNDNCVDNDEDEDVIVLSDENNAGAFNNSEAKFVEDNVNLSEDSSASSAEEEDQDEDDEAVRSVAGLEKDMSATAKV